MKVTSGLNVSMVEESIGIYVPLPKSSFVILVRVWFNFAAILILLSLSFFAYIRNLLVYPKGTLKGKEEEGKSLSIFLTVTDWEKLASKGAVHAEWSLRVVDQINGKHLEQPGIVYLVICCCKLINVT